MSTRNQLQPSPSASQTLDQLRAEFDREREQLVQAEAELAREQASINAFRMHARLRLDELVDTVLELRAAKQALLTRLQLLQQAQELGICYDEDDPFWRMHPGAEEIEDEEEVLLPTPTPQDKAAEKRLYRELARRFHPDLATSAVERAYRTTVMSAVNSAYAARDIDTLFDLAGELEPGEVAELSGIETVEVRRLRETILRCRHRCRKVRRELQVLRQENTARLWQRAQELEARGEDWWTPVRRELQEAIARREPELAVLRRQVEELEAAQAAPESAPADSK